MSHDDAVCESWRESCGALRKYLADAYQKNEPCAPSEVALLLLNLKSAHNAVYSTVEQLNDTRNQHNQNADQLQLRLQNLKYESAHIKQEIAKCRLFISRHTKLDIIDEQLFRQQLTQHTNSEHEFTLLRLQHEEQERKRLKQLIYDRTSQKQKLKEQAAVKQAFLAGLKSQVKTMIDSSKRLQDYFQLKSYETVRVNDLARMLPVPLYILYNSLVAHKNEFEPNMKVSIEGNSATVADFWKKTRESESEEANGSPSIRENDSTNGNVSANDVSTNDELSEQQPSRKKARVDANTSKKLEIFPLKVVCDIQYSLHEAQHEKTAKTMVTFHFLPRVNLVVADADTKIQPPLLSKLFPNDTGTLSPNAQLFLEYDFSNFSAGRPYKWAQVLCGQQFLEPLAEDISFKTPPPNMCTAALFVDWVRFKSRATRILNTQLRSLHDNKQVPPEMKHLTQSFGLSQKVTLTGFNVAEDDHNGQKRCVATFKRESVQVEAKIIIENDYPLSIPQFKLKSIPNRVDFMIPSHLEKLVNKTALSKRITTNGTLNDSTLIGIEQEIHTYIPQYVMKKALTQKSGEHNGDDLQIFYLLSHQMAQLQKCLNLHLEIELNQSPVAQIASKSGEIVSNNFCTRIAKGKDMQKPLVDSGMGTFVQRCCFK